MRQKSHIETQSHRGARRCFQGSDAAAGLCAFVPLCEIFGSECFGRACWQIHATADAAAAKSAKRLPPPNAEKSKILAATPGFLARFFARIAIY